MNISENNEKTNENLIESSLAGDIRRFFNNAVLYIDRLSLNLLDIITENVWLYLEFSHSSLKYREPVIKHSLNVSSCFEKVQKQKHVQIALVSDWLSAYIKQIIVQLYLLHYQRYLTQSGIKFPKMFKYLLIKWNEIYRPFR